MNADLRPVSAKELKVIETLLIGNQNAHQYLAELPELYVAEIDDGGMGSCRLFPAGVSCQSRRFQKQIAHGTFRDADGCEVSTTINIAEDGHLFELDVWKVDFTPLQRWPESDEITILGDES